jgi:hypothetical protein
VFAEVQRLLADGVLQLFLGGLLHARGRHVQAAIGADKHGPHVGTVGFRVGYGSEFWAPKP